MKRLQFPAALLIAVLLTASFVQELFTGQVIPLEIMMPLALIAAGAIMSAKNGYGKKRDDE